MKCHAPHSIRRRGFSLVELLVVVGIIVVLIGILTPMAMRSYRNAEITRVRMEFQTISTALEAYKQDHGDYPRVTEVYDDHVTANDNVQNFYRGAIILAKALVAPGPESGDGADGADGPGFRTRRLGLPGNLQGRVYGPYLKADSFRIGDEPGSATAGLSDPTKPLLFDKMGSPILYYPAAKPQPDITQGRQFVNDYKNTSADRPLYNWRDNTPKTPPALNDLQLYPTWMSKELGDVNQNGRIDNGETPRYTGPFILWAAGHDGRFGPFVDVVRGSGDIYDSLPGEGTDDIYNFD